MTAVLPNQLLTAEVIDTTNRVAALEHLPVIEAHELVSAIAPVATAAKLREIAHTAQLTMHVRNGCVRVVRADELLRISDELLDDADDTLDELRERHADDTLDPDARFEQLQNQLALALAMLGAVVGECVSRAKTQRLNWAEHPATPEELAKVETDSHIYWGRVALGGAWTVARAQSEVDVITRAGVA